MSKQKKAKKDRRLNISPAVSVNVAQGQGGGMEMASPSATADRKATTATVFNYTHVKKDLTRIGILAGSFITILIILSYFLNQ
jgi:hypothetical protein